MFEGREEGTAMPKLNPPGTLKWLTYKGILTRRGLSVNETSMFGVSRTVAVFRHTRCFLIQIDRLGCGGRLHFL